MRRIIALIIVLINLSWTQFNVSTIETNDKISPSTRLKISLLDQQLVDAIFDQNLKSFESVMSASLLKASQKTNLEMIQTICKSLDSQKPQIFYSYYIQNPNVNSSENQIITLRPQEKELQNHSIEFKAVNQETMVSINRLGNKNDAFLMTTIYGKYPEGWKLNTFHMGIYLIDKKSSPQYYALAQSEYQKSHLVNAINYMFLASKLSIPAGPIWTYDKKDEMKVYSKKLMTELHQKYNFPYTVPGIATKPKVMNLIPHKTPDGVELMIEYETQIVLADTSALHRENKILHQDIDKYFPGVKSNRTLLFYRVFHKVVDYNTPVGSLVFSQPIKKLSNTEIQSSVNLDSSKK